MKAVWILIIISLLNVSCEREADIPLPVTEPKMGLFCFLTPNKAIEVILVRVNPLFGPPGGNNADYVLDAQVWISNGMDTVELKVNGGDNYYSEITPSLTIERGRSYWIWADAPGLPPVNAACTVPLSEAGNLKVSHYGSIQDADSMFHLSMIWQDIPGQDNFYRIYAENIDSLVDNSITQDVYNFNTLYYSDDGNDGKVLQSGVGTYSRNPDKVRARWILANLITCESHYYRYHLGIETNLDGNPLLELSSLYSNVQGGVGCFGAYLLHTDKIRIF